MSSVYAGTSGWSYPSWKPTFYPAKLASAKFLGYYATRLNTVEVNYTFRAFPSEKMLTGWVAATPENFRFSVKAHQSITHIKRLQDAGDNVARFVKALQPLRAGGRLGPILFQLPPFLKCNAARLEMFLNELPQETRIAFEFRHESWFCDEIFDLLRKANAALCEAESENMKTPAVQTADFAYLRLRREDYSPAARKQIAQRVAEVAAVGDAFIYFKHEDTPEGALYAEELLAGDR
ncbi:MAG TPA: DUF72 domain-containing protein [Candidatus Acidoferrales bacterium]|nr:DUF72 domain-containing protein [Candidatus Acidoferrales bacterium]